MLYSIKKVHLIGIGGIGMSGIAELLKNKEFVVSGSDIADSPNVQRLIDLGIEVSIGHNKENISDADLVIYSDAIQKDNVELIEALAKNIIVYSRARMISEIAKLNNSTVAIAGTHGKTTTTSMVGTILKAMNLDPTIIVGGVVASNKTDVVVNSSRTMCGLEHAYQLLQLPDDATMVSYHKMAFLCTRCTLRSTLGTPTPAGSGPVFLL